MRPRVYVAIVLAGLVGIALYARSPIARAAQETGRTAKAEIGQAAPGFALKDTYGKEFNLAEFKGKIVVLEWLNPDCPVSHGWHDKKTMQDTYKKYAENVVWLGIDTTYNNTAEKDRVYAAQEQLAYPVLMDPEGKAGHAFGAQSTPHMFVIDKDGKLAYKGEIEADGTNYVGMAIESLKEGKPVPKPVTQAHGCRVHYKGK